MSLISSGILVSYYRAQLGVVSNAGTLISTLSYTPIVYSLEIRGVVAVVREGGSHPSRTVRVKVKF